MSKSALIIIVLILILGFLWFKINSLTIKTPTLPSMKACTKEAKICPDGSAVGRTGPNCEFEACPN